MRFVCLKPDRALGVLRNGGVVPISAALERQGLLPPGATMIELIERYEEIQDAIAGAARGAPERLDPKRLAPPLERPSKIWAAASNYRRGTSSLDAASGRGTARAEAPGEILELSFLKPPSAITGPESEILIPKDAQTIFPELELCAVIGKRCRHVPRERALEFVFGYTIILDVTARGYGSGKSLPASRCVRKGFESFAPIGPCIATRDEIPDPQNLAMRLWVNGELRQSAKTAAMINDVATLVSFLSGVGALYPGDLIATGNPDAPEFQKQLAPGDVLKASIEGIGEMTLYVARA